MRRVYIILLLVLLVDQVVKIWVKLNMYHLEPTPVFGDWFYLRFIENDGMAFGWSAGGEWGKLLLSVFRITAVVLIFRYVRKLIRKGAHKGLIASIALILAGAIGNIIDSMFYGIIFTESADYGPVATIAALGEGYAANRPLGGFLFGSVVDMLYFPMIEGNWPEWMPFVGGEDFQFFRPVFNIADAAISIGVGLIIIRQRAFFADQGGFLFRKKKKSEDTEAAADEEPAAAANGGSTEETSASDLTAAAIVQPNAPPQEETSEPVSESESESTDVDNLKAQPEPEEIETVPTKDEASDAESATSDQVDPDAEELDKPVG